MKAIDRLLRLESEELVIRKILDGKVVSVQYRECNVKDGAGLLGEYGRGLTVDDAAENYCDRISGKTLVFRWNETTRKEVTVLF